MGHSLVFRPWTAQDIEAVIKGLLLRIVWGQKTNVCLNCRGREQWRRECPHPSPPLHQNADGGGRATTLPGITMRGGWTS
ncbi:hypothetical protein ILYODFUR_022247 [Ilyodon furcidens]|uniref:Uncharacterized protein n=1 Tax=Ilyodon furcidens TaxID=33524 RepID=A0ABV0V5W5_9TELE